MKTENIRRYCSAGLLRVAFATLAASSFNSAAVGATPPTAAEPKTIPGWKTAVLSNVMVSMRDGTRLATDVYLPSHDGRTPASGRFPVLLMRTPYNKRRVATEHGEVSSTDALTAETANQHGYVVVYQDVRGAFDSEGKFEPMLNEGTDGYDTVAWLNKQPWSNGRIGTFGPSYMGGTQMLLAAEQPPGLVTAFSQVAATDQFKNDWVYMDGVFVGTAAWWTNYMLSIGGSAASRLGKADQDGLRTDFRAFGVADPGQLSPEAFERFNDEATKTLPLNDMPVARRAPWWHMWLENWNNPQHFQKNEMSDRFGNINIPILHVGGWYDLFLRNTYEGYEGMVSRAKNPAVRVGQRLIIGPWSHDSCGSCPANSSVDTPAMQLAWMDQWLKGVKTDYFKYPVVLYIMGENRWRAEDHWPLEGTQRTRFYLESAGGANTNKGDGALSATPPDRQRPDRFIYDPNNPAPTSGGPGIDGSRALQNTAEARSDVLVYSTPTLREDVEVTGEVSATLYAASSAKDTDWWMKLIDVAPGGEAYILTQGVVRARYRNSRTNPSPLIPGKIEKYAIDLRATGNVFKKGHRIRIEITSSNFPYADRNPNAYVNLASATNKDFVVASQTVYHDNKYPSFIDLPIIPQSRARNWIDTPFAPVSAAPIKK